MKTITKLFLAIICMALLAGLGSCTIGDNNSTPKPVSIIREYKTKAMVGNKLSNVSMITTYRKGFAKGDTILIGEHPHTLELVIIDTL